VPVFDPILRRLVARVVYDGPAFSGKTTNVAQICEAFPVYKRTEMYTPGSLKGRTMFFDWLEVDLGMVARMPLFCQVLSVPGQRARSYRRRPLIKSADAVVFVADCRPDQLAETKRCFALMRRYLREREEAVPIVVQANKQDAPGALAPNEMAAALRLARYVPTLPAMAADGRGVRETFSAAVKAAVRFTQTRVSAEGLGAIAGTAENADTLFDTMLSLEDDVEGQVIEDEPTDDELMAV
jgi:signal recognition particle receptor subunit beta